MDNNGLEVQYMVQIFTDTQMSEIKHMYLCNLHRQTPAGEWVFLVIILERCVFSCPVGALADADAAAERYGHQR